MSGNKAIFLLLTVPFIWLLNKTRAPINGRNPCLTAMPNSSIILRRSKTTKMALFEKFETLIYNKIKMDEIWIHWEAMCSVFIFKQISTCMFLFSLGFILYLEHTGFMSRLGRHQPLAAAFSMDIQFSQAQPPHHLLAWAYVIRDAVREAHFLEYKDFRTWPWGSLLSIM